jgi:hypothetical protein
MYKKKKTKFAKTRITEEDDNWLRNLFYACKPNTFEDLKKNIAIQQPEIFITDNECLASDNLLSKGISVCNCGNIISIDDKKCSKCCDEVYLLRHRKQLNIITKN